MKRAFTKHSATRPQRYWLARVPESVCLSVLIGTLAILMLHGELPLLLSFTTLAFMMGVTVPMVVMAFLQGRRAGMASVALTETPARPGIDEQLFHILDSALDAVIEIDPEGRVLCWNRQAEELFGSGSVFG